MARDDTRHLSVNRPMILERAAIASAIGALPVPIVDEMLSSAVRTTLVRRIAATRNVDLSDAAVEELAHPKGEPLLLRAGRGTAFVRILYQGRKSLGKLTAMLHIAGRVDEVAATFAVATLFDHYCARHHVGAGLDVTRAGLLRRSIDLAILDARGGLARRGLGRLGRGASNLLLAAPRAIARRGREVAVPLLGPPEAEPVAAGTAAVRPRATVMGRGIDAIAGALGDGGRGWVEELVAAFDARWSAAQAEGAP